MSRQFGVVCCVGVTAALLMTVPLTASDREALIVTNAYLDLGASPPTITLRDIHGAFGANQGQIWQLVAGTPEALVVVSWTKSSIVAELVSVAPGNFLIAVLPVGVPAAQRAFFNVAIGRGNPDPPCFDDAKRFADCGNGTVTDSASGLVWLRHGSCFGGTWAQANALAATLQDGQCSLTDGSRPGDWRLPTDEEWKTMVDPSCPEPPKIVGNGIYGGCYSDDPWASGSLDDFFWSSTTDPSVTDFGFGADLTFGFVVNYMKSAVAHPGWPVRDGR